MMKSRSLLPLLAFVALACADEPSAPPAADTVPPLATRCFGMLDVPADIRLEMQSVLDEYRRTGNARYCSPAHRLTPLHVAVATHRAELVAELLAKGADPNARALVKEEAADASLAGTDEDVAWLPGDTPLTLALRNITQRPARAEELMPVVQALLDGGAEVDVVGRDEGVGVLGVCAEGCWQLDEDEEYGELSREEEKNWEDIAIALIDRGAGESFEEAQSLIFYHWSRAFARLLESPQGRWLQGSHDMLCSLVDEVYGRGIEDDDYAAEMQEIARALRLTPELLNRPLPNGHTALNLLSRRLLSRDDYFEYGDYHPLAEPSPGYVDFLALLLECGADARLPQSAENPVCAADYIAACPAVQAELRRRGFADAITPPPHRFEQDSVMEQLPRIPAEAIRDEEILAHRELFEAMVKQEDFSLRISPAIGRALTLLYRVDAARTRALVCGLPFWNKAESWSRNYRLRTAVPMTIASLNLAGDVVLPPRWIADTARFAEPLPPGSHSPGYRDWHLRPQQQARRLVWLLARDLSAEADAVIDELCAAETPLALRSAAWSLRLHRAGLPDLCRSELPEWLGLQCRDIRPDAADATVLLMLRRADIAAHTICPEEMTLRITSPSDALAADTRAIVEALRQLGVPAAAAVYEEQLSRSKEEEKEEELVQRHAALMELELAYSRILWQHREQLLRLREGNSRREED